MAQLIRLKIDVKKLDKTAFFHSDKGPVYADLTFWLEDDDDQYGQCGKITQDLGKARRDAGEKGAIVGNGRFAQQRPTHQNGAPPPSQTATADALDEDDDLPF